MHCLIVSSHVNRVRFQELPSAPRRCGMQTIAKSERCYSIAQFVLADHLYYWSGRYTSTYYM
ncbi:hypothetical protein BDV97DRAFT_351818 [Delphinella strobiligena]|nr:hypothetical protein BDV97DRAFT_351818 [Delphinella strobiligena]